MSKNLAASVRTRLKQHSTANQQDFNLTLTRYGLERLLYRLSVSEHASNFLLKGALLFTLWYDVAHRPTRDADLLSFGPDDVDTAVNTFQEICLIPADDGVVFNPDSVKGSIIRKQAGYGGVRIDLEAKLDGARIALQVDIGFGDAVTPAPQAISYPVLLEDFPAPQLRAYPKYTVVAEKFHAVCLLGLANTRIQDWWAQAYDGVLGERFRLEAQTSLPLVGGGAGVEEVYAGVRVRSTLAQWVGICGVHLRVFIDTVVFSGIAHVGRTIFKSKACFVVIVRGYMYRVTLNFNFWIFDRPGSSIL